MAAWVAIMSSTIAFSSLFFFNVTATTEIYTLSLHDALPICSHRRHAGRNVPVLGAGERQQRTAIDRGLRRQLRAVPQAGRSEGRTFDDRHRARAEDDRSEEHTSELQSQFHLVCRLLLEKKNK